MLHLVRLEHEVGDRDLDTTDEVVCADLVRVPKLDGELLASADFVIGDEEESGLFPDRVEVLLDDAGRVELKGKNSVSR